MKKSIVLFFVIIIGVWSCSAPKVTVKKRETLPVERILKKVEAQRRKIKTFKATGIIKIQSRNFEGKGSVEIFIKRPDSLKISVFGPFGISVGDALITKNKYFYYDALHNRLYSGKKSSRIIKRIFKFNLPVNSISDLLLGRKNLTDKIYAVPVKTLIEKNTFVLFYKGEKDLTESLKFSFVGNDLLNYSLLSGNKKIFAADFSNFKKYGNFNIPLEIKINNRNDSRLTLDYRSVEVNEKIKSLALDVPSDAKKLRW